MNKKSLTLLLVLVAFAVEGCVKKPFQPQKCDRPDLGGCVIEGFNVVGNHAVGDGEIEEKIATNETKHVLGGVVKNVPVLRLWDKLTVEYERLDAFVLERDLARIERLYRARGYYEAHVQAGRVLRQGKDSVKVEIVVDEGKPVRVGKVDIELKDAAPTDEAKVKTGARKAVDALTVGEVFEEAPFEETKKKVLRSATNRGFAYAKVDGKANVDLARHEATVVYTLELGPRCVFGDVSIEGQGDLSKERLLAAIQIKKGQRFSAAALDSAEIALGDLGLFGSIDVVPQLSQPGAQRSTTIPVVFRVQPAALRAIKMGFGGELTGLVDRVEVHGLAGWDHRNLFGGLRHFAVELSPALTFNFPESSSPASSSSTPGMMGMPEAMPPTGEVKTQNPKPFILPEFKLRASLTQPGVLMPLEPRIAGLLTGAFRLYRPNLDNRIGYVEGASGAGLERSFWDSHVKVGVSLNVQYDAPVKKALGYNIYVDNPSNPPGQNLRPVFIPYVQATAGLDFRRGETKRLDPVNPHSGFYLLNDVQVAFANFKELRTSDVRIRPEIRGYVPIARRVTLALKLASGFLFPLNYGDTLRQNPLPSGDDPDDCYDYQVMQFRGFFSGGSTSNRGYAYQGVGPHQVVKCFATISNQADPRSATGGFNLWETSAELRFPIYGSLGSVVFVDASDVTLGKMRLCAPHLAPGFGLRYDTPVGPIRADIGVRIPGAQVTKGSEACAADLASDGRPIDEPKALGNFLPIAVSVAIGEAF